MDILHRITINQRLDMTLAQQLSQQLTWLIASGQLLPGDRLPPVRRLAEHLAISVNTVRAVYQRLEAAGLTSTRHGAGTRVLRRDVRRLTELAAELRSHTVGVILPSLSNPFYHPFLAGAEEVAHGDLTMLFVCNTHDDQEEAGRYFAQLMAKHVDGIIVVSHDTSEFLTPGGGAGAQLLAKHVDGIVAVSHDTSESMTPGAGAGAQLLAKHVDGIVAVSHDTSEFLTPGAGAPRLPLVTVDWPGAAGCAVALDLRDAGYQATRHLLSHGHRRVGLITWEQERPNVALVNAGYDHALHEAGVAFNPSLIARVPAFDAASGALGAR